MTAIKEQTIYQETRDSSEATLAFKPDPLEEQLTHKNTHRPHPYPSSPITPSFHSGRLLPVLWAFDGGLLRMVPFTEPWVLRRWAIALKGKH
eukprot:5113957-Amphidinium_carterae.2